MQQDNYINIVEIEKVIHETISASAIPCMKAVYQMKNKMFNKIE